MCCSVLQCVALSLIIDEERVAVMSEVCCSVLSVLQCVECVAVCCSVSNHG